MDQIQAVRRGNLRRLIDERGGAAIVARLLGHGGPSYLGQMLKGTRPISEKTARDIEEKLDLPYRTIDQEPGVDHLPFAGIDADLMAQCAYAVANKLDAAGIKVSATRVADLIIAVYEHCATAGAIDDAYIERMTTRIR